jgi:hypothetical protein
LLSASYKSLSIIHVYIKLLGIFRVGFDITDQLLIRFFALVGY